MSATANKDGPGAAWLARAAAPSFAAMALISAVDAPTMAVCTAGPAILPLDGMTAMYLLMALFHLPPWLKLAARNRPITQGDEG